MRSPANSTPTVVWRWTAGASLLWGALNAVALSVPEVARAAPAPDWPRLAYDWSLGVALGQRPWHGSERSRLARTLAAARTADDCTLLDPAAEVAAAPPSGLQIGLLLNQSFCWSWQGQHQRALDAVSQLEAHRLPGWAPLTAYVKGSILAQADRYRDAAAPLRLAVDLAGTDVAQRELQAAALAKLAFAVAVGGEHAKARRLIGESLMLARALGSDRAEGFALNQQAGIQVVSNQFAQSIVSMEQAHQRLRQSDDRAERMLVACNLAYGYARTGEFDQASRVLHEALALENAAVPRATRAILHSRLGYLYLALGDWVRAEVFLQQAVAHYSQLDARWRHAMALRLWGVALRELGRVDAGLDALRTALRVLKEDGHLESALEAASGILLARLAKSEHSEADLQTTLQLLADARVRNARIRAEAVAAIAQTLLNADRPRAALDLLGRAAASGSVHYAPANILLLHTEASVRRALGHEARALALSGRAIELSELLKNQLETQRLGPAWAARTAKLHQLHLSLLAERYRRRPDPALADTLFRRAEQARFRFLHASRDMSRNAALSVGPEALEAMRVLSASSDRLAANPRDPELRAAYHLAYANLESMLPAATPPSPVIGQLADISGRMADHELLIYFLGEHLLEVRRTDLQLRPIAALLPAMAQMSGLNPAALARETALLQRLGLQLLQTALMDPRITRVLMVADAHAEGLAVAAFDIDPSPKYEPAVSRFELLSLSGASSYFASAQAPVMAPVKAPLATVIADPKFAWMPGTVRAAGGWVERLPRLAAAASEARVLKALLGKDRVAIHLREQASSARLHMPETAHSAILHIATHSYVDHATGLSGVALSDGFFPYANFSNLAFHNRLVVISSCASSDGSGSPGEGRMSMSRAFLARGADATVSTHWPVADQASSQFMRWFYEAIAQGQTAAASLRWAQNRMRASTRFGALIHWGGYVLTAAAPGPAVALSGNGASGQPSGTHRGLSSRQH